jgi:L-lactate dehydrogenase
MQPFRPDTVLLLVANPVDILTYFAQKISGLPLNQVLGSGTFLDSMRLRGALAQSAHVSASSIDAYVLGEHGDSQFVAWSACTIGGVPIQQALSKEIDFNALAESTKKKALTIIESKGSTSFGIGSIVTSICGAILFDKRNIRPLSHYVEELDCCLSMPAVLGRRGVVRNLDMPLNVAETNLLRESAKALRSVIEACEEEMENEEKEKATVPVEATIEEKKAAARVQIQEPIPIAPATAAVVNGDLNGAVNGAH